MSQRLESLIVLLGCHAALSAGGLGMLATAYAAAPRFATWAAREANLRPGRGLVVGVGAAVSWLGLASLAEQAHLKSAQVALVVIGLALLAAGALAAAAALGERLVASLERRASPLGRVALGWLCLASLALVPLVGWLVLAVALLIGMGAALRAALGAPAPPDQPSPGAEPCAASTPPTAAAAAAPSPHPSRAPDALVR